MNLLMVLTLLLAWLEYTKTDTFESVARDAYDAIEPLIAYKRDVVAEDLKKNYDAQNSVAVNDLIDALHLEPNGWEPLFAVESLPLERLFALRRTDYDRVLEREVPGLEATIKAMKAGQVKEQEKYFTIRGHEERIINLKKHDEIARSSFVHLRELAIERGMQPTNTVLDLQKTFAREIDIPLVKQHLDVADVFSPLCVVVIALLAYIAMLMNSLSILVSEKVITEVDNLEPLDFVLLYRSKWAYWIGVPWMLLPVLIAGGYVVFPIREEHIGWSPLPLYRWILGALAVSMMLSMIAVILKQVRQIRASYPRTATRLRAV